MFYFWTVSSVSDLTAFDGRNIGVLKDHLPEDVLNEWEKENNLQLHHKNITTKEYNGDKANKINYTLIGGLL